MLQRPVALLSHLLSVIGCRASLRGKEFSMTKVSGHIEWINRNRTAPLDVTASSGAGC